MNSLLQSAKKCNAIDYIESQGLLCLLLPLQCTHENMFEPPIFLPVKIATQQNLGTCCVYRQAETFNGNFLQITMSSQLSLKYYQVISLDHQFGATRMRYRLSTIYYLLQPAKKCNERVAERPFFCVCFCFCEHTWNHVQNRPFLLLLNTAK